MTIHHYILKDGKVVIEPDPITWAMWFEKAEDRVVKQEFIGDSKVSTVFLGLDHNFEPDGPPILWETMVFDGKLDREMDRCAGNREQAEAMHARMAQRVRAAEKISSGEENQIKT